MSFVALSAIHPVTTKTWSMSGNEAIGANTVLMNEAKAILGVELKKGWAGAKIVLILAINA